MHNKLARHLAKRYLDRPRKGRPTVRQELQDLDRKLRGARGPEAPTSMVTVVGTLMCLAFEEKPFNPEAGARLLRGAARRELRILGCEGEPPSAHQLRRRIARLETYMRQLAAGGDDDAAMELLQPILDLIVAASTSDTPSSSVAIDGTLIKANTPRLSKEEIRIALDPRRRPTLADSRKRVLRRIATTPDSGLRRYMDVDARWRAKDKTLGKEAALGLQIAGLQSFAPDGTEEIRRLAIRSANAYIVPVALELILDVHRNDFSVARALGDREFSRDQPNYLDPVRAEGIQSIHDLASNQQGYSGTYKGALIIDGWLYSPAMPKRLWNLVRPGPTASQKSKADYKAMIAEREQYAFVRHSSSEGDPNQARSFRVVGPALRAKKTGVGVKCSSAPGSMKIDNGKLKLCRAGCKKGEGCGAGPITWGATQEPRTWQPVRFGSTEWDEAYNPRTAIERIFARLKSRRGANLTAYDLPRGLLRVGFVAAIAAAAVNLLPEWRRLA